MPDNRKGFASALHIRGLRQRWMFSAVLPILLLLVLAVALFSVGVQEYYYNAMRSGLESRARIAAETFTGYGVKSYSEYYRLASYSAETFEEKDTIELQFINTNGRVQVSSYGLTAGTLPCTSDVDSAIGGKMASFQGRDPQTGENILAVSYPLFFNSRVVGVLRYVTSLREAQHRVLVESLLASAAALVCMALIAASNAIFINNVVQPVAVVSDAARRISGGSYGIMIENHYRDELGELVDNINDMSLKISQAEKIQQEFISSVSHELRTPLTAISGWAETLSADPGANIDQTKRGLGIILKESRRLTTMVEELLEFTKMQDGRFTLRVESVDLASELEDAVYTYFELFRQEGIEVSYKGPDEDVPPIVADSERMKQVFCNVLDNAAKHGGAGKRIDVSAACEDGKFVIRVRDYGPGIPEEELPLVKKKFYKGSSKARGSGIGLAVCDEIVRLHGGQTAETALPRQQAPQSLADIRVVGKHLGHDVVGALQGVRRRLHTLLRVDIVLRRQFRRRTIFLLGQQQQRQRLQPLLPRRRGTGAALLLIGAVQVLHLCQGGGGVQGGGELRRQLPLGVDGLPQHRHAGHVLRRYPQQPGALAPQQHLAVSRQQPDLIYPQHFCALRSKKVHFFA